MKRLLPLALLLVVSRVAVAESVPTVSNAALEPAPPPAVMQPTGPSLASLLPKRPRLRKASIGLLIGGSVLAVGTLVALIGFSSSALSDFACALGNIGGAFAVPQQSQSCQSSTSQWEGATIGLAVPTLVSLITGGVLYGQSKKMPYEWSVPSVDLMSDRGHGDAAVAHVGFSF